MILSITLNPCVDRTLFVDGLTLHDSNRVVSTEMDAGGKGINAARIIAELGEDVVATGFLGGRTGKFVQHVLHDEGVVTDFVHVPGETRLNISVEDGSANPPTTFNERGTPVDEQGMAKLHSIIENALPKCKFVTAGGSLPPNLATNIYSLLIERAKAAGVKMVVDADGEPLASAINAKPFMVKPNADEAKRLLGRAIDNPDGGMTAAREIRSKGVEVAIVSMGKTGAVLSSGEGDFFAQPPAVEAVSTIGAGDSLIGGFLVGLQRGMAIRDAFALGVAAGAATASTSGAEIGRREVIERLLPGVIIRDL